MMGTHLGGWRRARRALVGLALTAAGVAVGVGHAGVAQAQGLPLCGGNQTIRPAPLTCFNTKTIDGTAITVVLDVTAAGVATATFSFDAPRVGDTPIRVRWHEGISSGPLAAETAGVIPAGSLGPVSLTVSVATCGGQIDTKAVFTANGDARGRVAAPYVGLDLCNQPTTTPAPTTTTAATTTTAPTTIAGSTTSGPSTSASVTSVAQSTTTRASVSPTQALPTTGGGSAGSALVAALVLVVAWPSWWLAV